MISCDQAVELISARLDEPLTAEEEAELAGHLAECASCRALQEDFQRLHTALTQAAAHWTVEPPEDLTQRIMESVRAAKTTPIQTKRDWWRRRSWAALAAVLVLAVVGGSAMRLLGGGMSGSSTTTGAAPAGGAYEADANNNAAAPECAPESGEAVVYADMSSQEADTEGGHSDNDTNDGLMGFGLGGSNESEPAGAKAAEDTGNPEGPGDSGGSGGVRLTVGNGKTNSEAEQEGTSLALELAYQALGGDGRWIQEPLPNIETVGCLLTPAYPEETDAPALAALLCVEAAAEDGVYQFHYHTYSGTDLTSAVQNAGYYVITVAIKESDTTTALEESSAEAGDCVLCQEILTGNGT